MCKTKLNKNNAYYIGESRDIYSRQEFVTGFNKRDERLEILDDEAYRQISNMELKESFGSKIDTISKHLLVSNICI